MLAIRELNVRIRELEIKLFQRDMAEADDWIEGLEGLNHELGMLLLIEKHVLRDDRIRYDLLAWRRANTLTVADLCKYQQNIKTEMEYGHGGHHIAWVKTHEKYRAKHKGHLSTYANFKIKVLGKLLK
ncbi:MAG TPA: hypothetical protein ENH91_05270 [Leeuwenhoekiella sp.]|nr:hypothetical protein [Leeuwenhoekiella sp.]